MLSLLGVQVRFLVGELRCHKSCSIAKNKQTTTTKIPNTGPPMMKVIQCKQPANQMADCSPWEWCHIGDSVLVSMAGWLAEHSLVAIARLALVNGSPCCHRDYIVHEPFGR